MNDLEKEHTTRHKQYRVYGDRELQNTLLSLDESDWLITADGEEIDSTVTALKSPSTVCADSKLETVEVCAWITEDQIVPQCVIDSVSPAKPRKNEKQRPKPDQTCKDWKDTYSKSKDIAYKFHHFTERKKHMENYRKGHTYGNSGLLKEHIIQLDHITSRLQSQTKGKLDNKLNTFCQASSIPTPRNNTDSDILELQHKYKFDPSALKEASVRNDVTKEKSPRDKKAVPAFEAAPAKSQKGSGRLDSAKSVKETIKARSSGTVNLTPTKISPLKHKSSSHAKYLAANGITSENASK